MADPASEPNTKLPLPEKFTGNRKKATTFVNDCKFYFNLVPHYWTNRDKIKFMLLLISDKAEQWKWNKSTELEEKGWTETFTEFTSSLHSPTVPSVFQVHSDDSECIPSAFRAF